MSDPKDKAPGAATGDASFFAKASALASRLAIVGVAPLLIFSVVLGGAILLPQVDAPTALPRVERIEGTETLNLPADGFTARSGSFEFVVKAQEEIWLRFTLPPTASAEPQSLSLESLTLESGTFWRRAATAADDQPAEVLEHQADTPGVVVPVPRSPDVRQVIVARIVPAKPTRIVVRMRAQDAWRLVVERFNKAGGVLAGFFLALGTFASVIALLNRDKVFWLFAGWLLTTYRIAAINGGWNLAWMGVSVGVSSSNFILAATAGLHGLLTVTLFLTIFQRRLPAVVRRVLEAGAILFGLLLITMPVIPVGVAFPLIRALGFVGLLVQCVALIIIATRQMDRPLALALAGWTVNIGGTLLTILYGTGHLVQTSRVFNSQTAALGTGLLVAIALADRLRLERQARMKAQSAAVGALRRFQTTYDSVPAGLFSMKPDGSFIDFNPAFGEMLVMRKRSDEQMRKWHTHFMKDDLTALLAAIDVEGSAETEISDREGQRWYQIRAKRSKLLIEGSITDVTQRRYAEDQLRRLADHDSLTDLLNRRGFDAALLTHLDHRNRGAKLCIASLDLDRFKLINDMFGHASGDQVLKEVAVRMRKVLPAHFITSRLGGDEFAILMPDTQIQEAESYCEVMIKATFGEPFQVVDKMFTVFGSVGLVELSDKMSRKDAMSAADRACGEAKRRGGNKVTVYGQTARELVEHLDELRMVEQMGAKLPADRMRLLCQPIVSLQAPFSNLNYEALLRLVDNNGALTSPARLIQAAERHGFMARVDRWVLGSVLRWLDEHPEHREQLNYCAVNLSGASLNDERFLQDVMAMIREHPKSTTRLCFEVTETVALYDLKNSRRFIDRVRAFGAKVALDDFGAGYTSFSYMKELRVDLIKIDGAYVRTMKSERSNYSITRTIVDLAREMGTSSVAEWAEDAEVVEMLALMGVDYAQGYALSVPLPMDRMLGVRSSGELVERADVRAVLNQPREPVFKRPVVPARGGRLIIPV